MADQPRIERVVADADVLATDLLVGGDARDALDHVRRHSWVELVASDALLERTEQIVTELTDANLANDHRERLEAERIAVEHPPEDHPALASAYHSEAAHLLSYDETLRSPQAALSLQPRVSVSVRPPDAFARLFDPESVYREAEDGTYPGPDRNPRD